MQLAQSLNDRAEEYMIVHDTDYPTALRAVARLSDSGAAEPSIAEVERYMREHRVEDFGQAVRQVARERGLVQEPVDNSVGGAPSTGTSPADEDAEIKRIARERGYDL